jgi:hypothetical protein
MHETIASLFWDVVASAASSPFSFGHLDKEAGLLIAFHPESLYLRFDMPFDRRSS